MALAVIGMIFAALTFGEKAPTADPMDGYKVSGTSLQGLVASPGTTMSFAGDKTNPIAYAVLGADFKANEQKSPGVFTLMAPQYSKAYAGKKLRLTVRARAGKTKPSRQFFMAFFAFTEGRKGWQKFEPTAEFQDFEVITKLGAYNAEQPEIYFAVWPDSSGDGRTLEVESFEVEIIE